MSLVPAGVPYEDFPGVVTVRTIEDFYALAGDGVGEMSVIGTYTGSGIRHALEALARLANADAAADAAYRTFAFGDSENDLPLTRVLDHRSGSRAQVPTPARTLPCRADSSTPS